MFRNMYLTIRKKYPSVKVEIYKVGQCKKKELPFILIIFDLFSTTKLKI